MKQHSRQKEDPKSYLGICFEGQSFLATNDHQQPKTKPSVSRLLETSRILPELLHSKYYLWIRTIYPLGHGN